MLFLNGKEYKKKKWSTMAGFIFLFHQQVSGNMPFIFPNHINLCIKPVTPSSGHFFYPQSNYLNKVDRGPLSDATYQISRLLGLVASDNFFYVFPIKAYVKK